GDVDPVEVGDHAEDIGISGAAENNSSAAEQSAAGDECAAAEDGGGGEQVQILREFNSSAVEGEFTGAGVADTLKLHAVVCIDAHLAAGCIAKCAGDTPGATQQRTVLQCAGDERRGRGKQELAIVHDTAAGRNGSAVQLQQRSGRDSQIETA